MGVEDTVPLSLLLLYVLHVNNCLKTELNYMTCWYMRLILGM